MSSAFNEIRKLWQTLQEGTVKVPTVVSIPPNRCRPIGSAGYPIVRNEMYFTVRLNEMHLAANRQWWSVYDPMILIVVEFNYGSARVAVPAVVGPALIRKHGPSDVPTHGVVLQDIPVTGSYPYRGGNVDISASFYRVERTNYAHALLKAVDTLSSSLSLTGQMEMVAKVGSALLGIVEGMIGLEGTKYLSGHRVSLAVSPLNPFNAGYSAVITPPAPENVSSLLVIDHRLHVEHGERLTPYRDSDFALMSIIGSETREDINLLPFYPLKKEAISAIWDGEDGIKRGKANLIAAYQQMRNGDDITEAEAGKLFDAWVTEFEAEKIRLERTRSMPVEPGKNRRSPLADDFDGALKRLGL
jgi:hypothetical protein